MIVPDEQVTLLPTLSGHWYRVGRAVYPSSTTILQAYPKGEVLTKWIADHGWEESQKLRDAAGRRGTRVHNAIESLLHKEKLDRGVYALEEWWKINLFVDWFNEYTPQVIETEKVIWSKKNKFAGTFDLLCTMNDLTYVIDYKTSKYVYKSYHLQNGSYAGAIEEITDIKIDRTAVLHLGSKTKKGYSFKESEDWKKDYKNFLAVRKVFECEYGSNPPSILALPKTLRL